MFQRIAGAYRSAFRGLPREIWLLAAVTLVNRAGSMVLPFFSLYLTRERDLSVTQAGWTLGVYGLGAIGGAWAGGWSSDRLGSTRTQQLSLVATGIGFLLLSRLTGLTAIGVAVFLLAIVAESFRPAAMAECAHRAPPHLQARSFALIRLAINLGVSIGPAAGGFLALFGYGWLFVADALTCWAAALLLLLVLRPVRPLHSPARGGPEAGAPSPWRDPPFLGLLALVVALSTVFFQVLATLPLYYREVYGFREDRIGMLLALNALLIVLFEMVLIHWAEGQRTMRLVGWGCLLVCGGFGLMPFGASVLYVMGTIAVWTLGEMLAFPLLNVVVARRAPPSHHGRYMGAYIMAWSVSFVMAPLIGTWVWERFGPAVLWQAIGTLALPFWLVARALGRRREAQPPADPGPQSPPG